MKRKFIITGIIFITFSGISIAVNKWKKLSDDEIHDTGNKALSVLQEPSDALNQLSPDTAGNMVNWVDALEKGEISPRHDLKDTITESKVLESSILLKDTSYMPMVLFPHKPHTQWLSCANCHEGIFKSQAGATEMSMFDILEGKACGQCHGAVAFPLTECNRCHSVPHDSPQARKLLNDAIKMQ